MEPVILEFQVGGAYKTFQPSLSETFGYVLEGSIQVKVGKQVEIVSKGGRSISRRKPNIKLVMPVKRLLKC